MNKLFSILIVALAVFALCSCQPKNEYADPSSKVNWHDAPFDKCNEDGVLDGFEGIEKVDPDRAIGKIKDTAEEYGPSDYAIVSATLDGRFFYALKPYEKVGYCLSIYKRVPAEEATTWSYKFLNGCYYNLEEEPLASYQLTIRPFRQVDCYACKSKTGKVYVSKPIEIVKAVNRIDGSDFPEEDTSLKGFFYYVTPYGRFEENFFATQVFTYKEYHSIHGYLDPAYVYYQVNNDTDTFDSSTEGWDKHPLSSLAGYFSNGMYNISWTEKSAPYGDYKP